SLGVEAGQQRVVALREIEPVAIQERRRHIGSAPAMAPDHFLGPGDVLLRVQWDGVGSRRLITAHAENDAVRSDRGWDRIDALAAALPNDFPRGQVVAADPVGGVDDDLRATLD